MAFWILKTEPDSYSWDDLVRDGQTIWNGVKNAQALINIRAMQAGDQALIYHSGKQRALVGIAHITSAAYADPAEANPKLVVVDVKPDAPLQRPVLLSEIKAEPAWNEWTLVRQSRLSVVPCSPEQWAWIAAQAQNTAQH